MVIHTSVMPSGEIVGSIFLPGDKLLGVKELAIGPCPNFINDGGLKINKNSSRHMFPWSSLAKEGVEGIVSYTHRCVTTNPE